MHRTTKGLATLATALLAATPLGAHADAVLDWNAIADVAPLGGPPQRARILAMMHVAIHDALNAIDRRYETYLPANAARAGASADAAINAASYRVLAATVPSSGAALLAIYSDRILALPPCAPAFPDCVEDGIAAGEAAAFAMLADRAGDGSLTPHLPYTVPLAPGVYRPTPPAFLAPQFAGWAAVKPFVMRFGAQFRMDPPEMFVLTSDAYTRDFLEVKRVGDANAQLLGNRTDEQSGIARFWPGGGANINTGVTRKIVEGLALDRWEHARLFALVTMGMHDAAVAAFDTKFTYNFWRPVTAIRLADTDGNPSTEPDTAWLSYVTTPPYPDFTCGLPNLVGAGLEALRRYFGTDDVAYTYTAVGVTRQYASLSQAGAEAVDARVYGGMHFRTGCEHALRQGTKVGRFAVQHYLRPLKGGRSN